MSRSSLASFLSQFEHPVVLVSYALIALVMSAPLGAQFGDHIPGVDGDVWSYLWGMGWARVSLLNLGTNPFHTDYIFYPLGGATQLLWGTALPSFASIPLQLAFGLVPAFNLVYLAASVLTGYGMYLLGKEVLATEERGAGSGERLACFIAGLVFAFGALRMGYGIAFTNLFHTEFIPFYVLFLLRATRHAGFKNAILAGLMFALNVYVDFQIAAFLVVLTGLWFLWVLIPAGMREASKYARARDGLRVRGEDGGLPVVRWGVMVAVAGILALPMLAFLQQDFAIEGGDYIRVYPLKYSAERSYDVLSFFVPNARSTFYEPFAPHVQGVNASVNTPDDSELSPDRQSFLGLTVMVLMVLGIIGYRRRLWFWILTALVFAALSLGPVLHVAGTATNLPLPFALVNNIPILNHIRIPMRYGVMFFFSAALVAGAGAIVLLERRAWLAIPIGVLVLLEAGIFPYPTLAFPVPPVYEQIARQPGDFTVLEIPSFNWRYAAKNEAYQVVHQKRILRAYTNRIAPDLADYFSLRATPIVVKTMRILEGAEPNESINDRKAQDRAVLMDTLRFFNLRYAVVHRDQVTPEQWNGIDIYLRDVLQASVFYQDDAVTGYQFPAPPAAPPAGSINLADDANLMYLGRGWQIEPLAQEDGVQARYVKGTASELYIDGNAGATLGLRILNQDNDATLAYRRDGQARRDLALPRGWHTLSVPNDSRDAGALHVLTVEHSQAPETIAIGSLQIK